MPRVSSSAVRYRARHVAPKARRGSQVALAAAGAVPAVAAPVFAVVHHDAHHQAAPQAAPARASDASAFLSSVRAEQAVLAKQEQRVRQRAAALELRQEQRRVRAQQVARARAAAERRRLEAMDPKLLGARLAAQRGWGGEQFQCLYKLWHKESSWQANADNPTSSAYGIPQALPGNRMASAGADWRTNPATQIRWGLDYIADRYGTPCAAWGHSQATNWY